MANLDEELLEQQSEEPEGEEGQQGIDEEVAEYQRRQEVLENFKQRQRLQAQQSQKNESPQDKVQKARKLVKWGKRLMWVGEFVAATIPIWGPILLVIFIAGTYIGGCNGSTAFRIASLGTCEPFMLGSETYAPTTTQPAAGGTTGDAEARAYLFDNGITVNKPYPQTSLAGMHQTTLTEIVNFKQACDAWAQPQGKSCGVIVTGGTENAHAEGTCSHANGYKADIGVTATIDQYITTKFIDSGIRSDGAHMYTEPGTGAVYARETNPAHWDMVVGCGGNA